MRPSTAQITAQLTLTTGFQQVIAVYPFAFLRIKRIHLCNTSSSPVTVSICFVPGGGAAGQGNAALWNFSLAGNDFIEWGKDELLPAGTVISALAGTGAVINLFFSGEGI